MAEREYSVDNLRQLVKAQLVETIKEMEEAMLQLRYRELNKSLPPNSHVEPGEHEAVQSGVQPHMEPGTDEQFGLDPIGNNPIGHSQQPVSSGTGIPMNGLPSADMCPMCGNGDEPGSCQCLGKNEGFKKSVPVHTGASDHWGKDNADVMAKAAPKSNAGKGPSVKEKHPELEGGSAGKLDWDKVSQKNKDILAGKKEVKKAGTIHDAGSIGGAGDKTSVDNPDDMAKGSIATNTAINDQADQKLIGAVSNATNKIGRGVNQLTKDGSDVMDGMGPNGSGPSNSGSPGMDMAMSEADVKKAELLKSFGFKKSEHCKKCGNLSKMCKCMAKKSAFAKSAKQEAAERMKKALSEGDRINAVDEKKGSSHDDRLEPTEGAGTLPQDKVSERVKSGNDQDVPMEGEKTHTVKGEEMEKMAGRIHGAPVKAAGAGYGPGHFPEMGAPAASAPGLKAPPASVKPNKVSIRPVAKPTAPAVAKPAPVAPAVPGAALKAEMSVPTAKPPKAVVGGMPKAPKAAGMGTLKNEGAGKALAEKDAHAAAKSEGGGKALAEKLANAGATAKSEGGKALAMKLAGSTKKSEPLAKPSVSQDQNAAMHAAAEGKSNIGIPKSVGKEFVAADHGKKVGSLPQHKAEPQLSPGTPKSSEQHGAAPAHGQVDQGGMPGSSDPGTGVRKGLHLPHKGGVMAKGMGMGMSGGAATPGADAGAPTMGNGMALTQHEPGEHEGEKNKFAADKRTASADPSIAGKNPEASDYNPKDYSGFVGKDEEKLDGWVKGKK